jgi:hypothetical protein
LLKIIWKSHQWNAIYQLNRTKKGTVWRCS